MEREESSTVRKLFRPQRAEGPATVLAIGTATPAAFVEQATYPDFYFGVTNSNHMTDLKDKFIRLCKGSTIEKRHIHLTEGILMENRNLCSYVTPSLDVRQEILAEEVPKLAKKAAMKAIKEWGQPISKITHLVFSTTSGVDMPGADYKLLNLLGLQPSVKRFMLYHVGCFAGATILRLAKDLAENNAGARVLAVCSEISAVTFHGPSYNHIDSLVAQAIFGDGAAAVVVGADPLREIEWPIFEIVSASQTIIPGSEGRIKGRLQEAGLVYHLLKDVPGLVSKNIHNYLKESFGPLGVEDWNSIFWVAHPGGRAILDKVEEELNMSPERLAASRKVMREYGLMMSATVLFVMDEMRRRSAEEGAATTGEGLEWGVLLSFGPGLTVETMVLRSLPLSQTGTL